MMMKNLNPDPEPQSEPCRPKSPDPQDDDTVVEVKTNGRRVLYVADDEADNPELRQIKKNIFSLNTFLKEKWKLHKRRVPVWLLKLDGLSYYDRLQFSCNPTTGLDIEMDENAYWRCGGLEEQVQYLKLFCQLRKSAAIKLCCDDEGNRERLKKIAGDFPRVGDEDQCYEDYINVYYPAKEIEEWIDLHSYLFNDNKDAKDCYFRDPISFLQNLDNKFPCVGSYKLNRVMKGFDIWWKSGLEQDKENAEFRLKHGLKEAKEFSSNRLRSTTSS